MIQCRETKGLGFDRLEFLHMQGVCMLGPFLMEKRAGERRNLLIIRKSRIVVVCNGEQ